MMIDFALHNIRNKDMTPRDAIYDASLVVLTYHDDDDGGYFWSLAHRFGIGASAEARRPLGSGDHWRVMSFSAHHTVYHSQFIPRHGEG